MSKNKKPTLSLKWENCYEKEWCDAPSKNSKGTNKKESIVLTFVNICVFFDFFERSWRSKKAFKNKKPTLSLKWENCYEKEWCYALSKNFKGTNKKESSILTFVKTCVFFCFFEGSWRNRKCLKIKNPPYL